MALLTAERVERPLSLFGPGPGRAETARRDGVPGGGPTLDDAIVGVWEGLAARAVVACPLCGGALHPRTGHAAAAPPDVAGGRCRDCGTTLA